MKFAYGLKILFNFDSLIKTTKLKKKHLKFRLCSVTIFENNFKRQFLKVIFLYIFYRIKNLLENLKYF